MLTNCDGGQAAGGVDFGADLGPEYPELERRLWYAFFDLDAEVWRRLTRQLRRNTGLSEPDFMVLVCLFNSTQGQLREVQLGRRTGYEKARLNRHLGRMAERGLIHRRPAKDDRRGTVVRLSASGRAAIRRARPIRAGHIRQALVDPLSPGEMTAFVETAERILRHLRALPADL